MTDSSQNETRNERSFEALSRYMEVRTRLAVLEMHENDCRCEEFYTCSHCKESRELNHESHQLMNLWGHNWATLLWSYREEISQVLTEEERHEQLRKG